MTDDELKEHVKAEVYKRDGIKISSDDPVFAYLTASQVIQDRFAEPILTAIGALPGALAETLERVIAAVEEAERTAESLSSETKGTMAALAKLQVEAAHQGINDRIADSVANGLAVPLEKANAAIALVERKALQATNHSASGKSNVIVMALSISMVVLSVMFSLGLYVLYKQNEESKGAASYWHDLYMQQPGAKVGSGLKK